MDIDDEESDLPTSSSSKGDKKRFEVKKVSRKSDEKFFRKRITNVTRLNSSIADF